MARNNKKIPKSGAGTLGPLTDPEITLPPSRLEGRKLTPLTFRPEGKRDDEADGAPLSRFGAQFREVFAKEHGIVPEAVDLGIIRQVEALNADDNKNMSALTAVQTKRTEHGILRQVRLVVNTPLLFPWLLNGRALRRMGGELRGGRARLVTSAEDHEVVALPVMRVEDAESVVEIVSAQRRLLGLTNYTTADTLKKARIDSIVQFGVLDPPDVVMTQLVSDDGSAWVAQAAEGAQRLFSALVAMDAITNRSVGNLATERWLRNGDSRLHDITPDDLVSLPDALKFGSSAARGYFPGSDVGTWMETVAATTPAAVAFQLLRTMEINLIIAVVPDPEVTSELQHPVSGTIQELIRGYHMPGKSKEQWRDADIFGLIAIGAVDEFLADGRVAPEERSHWLGESDISWSGPAATSGGLPGNRLHMVTKLLAALTAQGALPATADDAGADDSLEIVNTHLRLNSKRVHSDERAHVAAAQTVAALTMDGSGWEGTLQAALYGAFRHSWFWKTSEHPGAAAWPSLLGTPVPELARKAKAERAANAGADNPDLAGPAQRALAALGGVALMINPGLIEMGKAVSRTGRGAGGKVAEVSATDPSFLLRAMAHDDRGIDQLEAAVVALVATDQQMIPLDKVDDEVLTDFYLRKLWLGPTEEETPEEPVNPHTEFARRCKLVADSIAGNGAEAELLREILGGTLMGLPEPEEDADYSPDLWGDPIYEEIGISEAEVDRILPVLHSLVDFFQVGKAYSRAASRAAR